MKSNIKTAIVSAFCGALMGCASPDVQQYQKSEPKLDLAEYFLGTTDAWGMFQKRNGDVVKRFHVEITGTQQAGKLILDERFKYDDGSTQQRVWTLVQQADGSWRGTADDVKGEAVGKVAGNALNWQYTLLLPVDGKTYEMKFDDWMFLIDRKSMINRASMSKFGFELGQVTLFFKKRD
ncbi:DUF3833 domain-containing protein [Chitinibacter bivalviorum]|uniref:DUF3833 domain-containing protein n=1 Tax=Chitinibacter bivalviorum TaxID=2739434 RepID=A0A7H9BIW5_9NEIS|nr:DUF3833 domain-containing protein [Chitinibacter bivalviorum]QLG87504.1 DUF3833 domain-containing protein [Chitinibacter bivalviorum]